MILDTYEAGDNLFEVIFEIDRKLQHAQQPLVPLSGLMEAMHEIERVLLALTDNQPESSNSIFLKLIDCFCRCVSNSKRQEIATFLAEKPAILRHLSAPQTEAFKRLRALWDSSLGRDFETCRQILRLFAATLPLFFLCKPFYALLYEALDEDISGRIGALVYAADAQRLLESTVPLFRGKLDALYAKNDQESMESLLQLYYFSQQVMPHSNNNNNSSINSCSNSSSHSSSSNNSNSSGNISNSTVTASTAATATTTASTTTMTNATTTTTAATNAT